MISSKDYWPLGPVVVIPVVVNFRKRELHIKDETALFSLVSTSLLYPG